MGAVRVSLQERSAELATIKAALSAAAAGIGRVLFIEGPAGIGKSSLLEAAEEGAGAAGLAVLRARGGELEREHPFGLVRQLLEPAVARLPPAGQRSVLSGAAAPAAGVLGMAGSAAGPGATGWPALHAIFWLTSALVAEHGALITVDDAQWGDASSLRALDYLARRIGELNVVLLISVRAQEPATPEALIDQLRTVPQVERLEPAPLGAAAAAAVVRGRLPDAGPAVCAACSEVTGGNPLLLAELLRVLATEPGTPTRAQVRSAAIPTLEVRILRRAAQVGEDAPALAQAMAVLEGGRLSLAAGLAEIDTGRAAELAHGLRRIEVLAGEDPFEFVHPLVRRSLYDGLPEPERHRLHRRAAELLTAADAVPESAAAHLARLPVAGSATVAAAQLEAADSAQRRGAVDEAIDWLERALAENAPEPPRPVLMARVGLAQAVARDPRSMTMLQAAYDELTDPELRGEVAVELGYTLALAGAWEQAAAHLDSASRELAAQPEASTRLVAMRASLELYDPRRAATFDARRSEYERLARGQSAGAEALTVVLSSGAALQGHVDEARAWLHAALRSGRLVRDPGADAWVIAQLLAVPVMIDDLDLAETLIREVDTYSRISGSAIGILSAVGTGGWVQARRGDLAGAEADLVTGMSFAQQAGIAMGVANMAMFLIDVLLERSSAAAAVAAIEAVELPPDFEATWSGAMLLEAKGRLRVAAGDRAAGIAYLRTAGRINRAISFGPVGAPWRSALAIALGPSEEAVTLAEEELALARATGLPRGEGIALRALGVALGPSDDGVEKLRESVAVLDGVAPLERARSLAELGAAFRRQNHRLEARATLDAALDLANNCGAERLRERIYEELAASGGRRRRTDQEGVGALTASELRVARLAGEGLSNVEIAQSLYISLKTVETHLSRAYAKLGLAGAGSRLQLASLLTEPEAHRVAASG